MKLRKISFSLTILFLSLLTMVATTFAWVGITTNSTFDEFSIKLKTDSDMGSYGVQLSLSGHPNTFSDSIDSVELKRQILKNIGRSSNFVDNASDEAINVTFAQQKFDQCTPLKADAYHDVFSDREVQVFENILDKSRTKNFVYFDVYASIYAAKADVMDDTSRGVSLFLRESIISSNDIGTTNLLNKYKYPNSTFSIGGVSYSNPFSGNEFSGKVNVNPASAVRVCVQTFEPLDYETSDLTDCIGYKIYQYDDNIPYYDNLNNIYSFGGILPSEHNMAYQQYNMSHPGAELSNIPDWQINRGDITYKDSGNIGRICSEEDGLTVTKKIKFRIYFWFEGWDSDCFEVIDKKVVNINLSFSNKAPYDV